MRSSLVHLGMLLSFGGFLAPACEPYAVCSGDAEQCGCEVDTDCQLTPYHTEVEYQEDCYPTETCCEPGVPMNHETSQDHWLAYQDVGCAAWVSPVDCPEECDPRDEYWPECHDGTCVAMHRRR